MDLVLKTDVLQYKVISKLSEGEFSTVYLVKEQDILYAFKLSKRTGKGAETSVYQHIFRNANVLTGIPKLHESGIYNDHEFLVMEHLGPPIKRLARKCLPDNLLCEIVVVIIRALEKLHDSGWSHCDVKPSSILSSTRSGSYALIDYAHCKKLSFEDLGKKEFTGNVKYASANFLISGPITRRDDLESLGYSMSELHLGKLPWPDAADTEEERKEIAEMKDATSLDTLCGEFSHLETYMKYVRSLGPSPKPDYDRMRDMFR